MVPVNIVKYDVCEQMFTLNLKYCHAPEETSAERGWRISCMLIAKREWMLKLQPANGVLCGGE